MEATALDENINPVGKEDAGIKHMEKLVDEDMKAETPTLTRAQIRRFTILTDLRVLPMLGIIYAVSILDRINVRLLPQTNSLSTPIDFPRSAPPKS